MEWLVNVGYQVGQNPDGELLASLGLLCVGENIAMACNLCRSAPSIGTVFAVPLPAADWNVIVMPSARPRNLHIEPILVLIKKNTERRQVRGPHNRLDFRASLGQQELPCDEPDDAMPFRPPGCGIGDRSEDHDADQNRH